jgi:Double-GTPase 2
MSDTIAPSCRKPGCQSATTKSCAEGHVPLDSCPWFGTNGPRDDFPSEPKDGAASADTSLVILPSGAPLSPQTLDEFLRAYPIRLIAIVGDPDSGKTTLICAVYECFLKGRFPDWRFTGSRTLVGFEERSHDSRTASGRVTPDTARTPLAESAQFFHLGTRVVDDAAAHTELMLADRAGEAFAAVRDKPAIGAQLIEVVKADRVAILLDGKRVVDSETRGSAMQGVRKLLRALINGGAITKRSEVQILLTKKDLIAKAENAPALGQKIDDFFRLLVRDFGSEVVRLSFWEIAARDPSGDTPTGLAALLTDWLEIERTAAPRAPISGSRRSEFDRLLDRAGLDYLP